MREYDENFDYNNDDEDEDSVCLEAFMDGWDSEMEEEIDFEENDIDFITQVFMEVNQTMSIKEAMKKLMDIMQKGPHKKQKAAGALGGAVKNKFLVRNGENFTRVR